MARTHNKNGKKFIFFTGGVASSLGKGLAAASVGALLERRGIDINMLKMDPYINVDPGTMGPTQHGEVFVTEDGAETDLDLGHYERFTSLQLSQKNNFTTGQVYLEVIGNERRGKYLGKTVQVVPHITDEIKRRIHVAAEGVDLLLSEIGGTVGDIESGPFLEAIRQFAGDVGVENVLFIHLVLIPYISAARELKSKPAQHSLKELRSLGLFPHIIICRSDREIGTSILDKVALFSNVPKERVFQSRNVDNIYQVPLDFHRQGLDEKITELLGIWSSRPHMKDLEQVLYNFNNPRGQVKVGVVGKYTELTESYKSLDEALRHGAIANRRDFIPVYIDSEVLEKEAEDEDKEEKKDSILSQVDGILVPGGFAQRGTEGKIKAIQYAREHDIPFLGICLGMQLAIIEFARHIAGLEGATSEEFFHGENGEPSLSRKRDFVIHYMEGQGQERGRGGSMRLGAYLCQLKNGSMAQRIYGANSISERHRHRCEVNNHFVEKLEEKGLVVSGRNPKLQLVEVVELPGHPYFIGCQYHPEFKSRPFSPHPLFKNFIAQALKYGKRKT